ncbi:RHS repeat domain-containing protein [Ramlibacter sp.]|uniref:RHS repeat domain-containing protein n=1 Tax=Ramlibacter sp. TaxID=1917967 RepID=UPI0039C97D7A
MEYFPFGETWVEESSNTQRTPYLFTAKELDEETGLYYFGARYYDTAGECLAECGSHLGEVPSHSESRRKREAARHGRHLQLAKSWPLHLRTFEPD